MRRAFLALALVSAASAAVLAAPRDDLSRQALRMRREIRRQAAERTLSDAELRSRLAALKALHEKAPDPKTAASLARAESNLELLLAGQPLPPPEESDEAEGEAAGDPADERESPIRPAPELDAVRVVAAPSAPAAAAGYFDRSRPLAAAVVAFEPDLSPSAELTGWLSGGDDAARRARLREASVRLLASLGRGDAAGARADALADRLHKRLSTHPHRERFASLRLRAAAGRLRLAYALRDGTRADEDLGDLAEWTSVAAAGGAGGGRGP
ncbi:MAG: hypothetical protein HY079_09110, partial [Elusimicrobia bacterium]|nr:hypothetical protein [Elusimicrobiota bacterium]